MFNYSARVDLTFPVSRVFDAISVDDATREKGFIAGKLRTMFPNSSFDRIGWTQIGPGRAEGVYQGGGKHGLRGMIFTMTSASSGQAILLTLSAPGYVVPLFWVCLLIGLFVWPMLGLLILGYFSVRAQSKRFLEVVSAELRAGTA